MIYIIKQTEHSTDEPSLEIKDKLLVRKQDLSECFEQIRDLDTKITCLDQNQSLTELENDEISNLFYDSTVFINNFIKKCEEDSSKSNSSK